MSDENRVGGGPEGEARQPDGELPSVAHGFSVQVAGRLLNQPLRSSWRLVRRSGQETASGDLNMAARIEYPEHAVLAVPPEEVGSETPSYPKNHRCRTQHQRQGGRESEQVVHAGILPQQAGGSIAAELSTLARTVEPAILGRLCGDDGSPCLTVHAEGVWHVPRYLADFGRLYLDRGRHARADSRDCRNSPLAASLTAAHPKNIRDAVPVRGLARA